MARSGHALSRPLETRVVFVSTPEMDRQAAHLLEHAAVLWLGGRRTQTTTAADISDAIVAFSRVPRKLFRVIPHYPEEFLVMFNHRHHRDAITGAPGRFGHGGLDVHAAAWRLTAHHDLDSMPHHVHLCLEGVPLNGWSEDLVARIVGDECVIDYFDVSTMRKEDAAMLNIWAWASCPSKVPRVAWLTIIDGHHAPLDVRAT